ncbi:MAG TPA: tripartite tricarboxylate transporter substrate binding protein [Burkholderiaceae bacterium]|nr:tripartite tricarboxylate transporter substrate binding protein [Burkholderiaceae bacterium]
MLSAVTRRMLVALLACGAAFPYAAFAQAGTYPNKPVRVVVGVPPGGATDLVARLVAEQLSKQTGQQFVVDNRGGAGGNIGGEIVAKSPPDGYTLFIGPIGTMAINPFVYAKMPFDSVKDFAPISQLTSIPIVMAVNPSVPAKDVREFIAYAKANPGKVNFGSGGNGTQSHISGVMLNSLAGIDMTHIPYKGNGPAMVDLLAGRVSVMFDQISSALPHIRAGKLNALGVTTAKRSAVAPDIPTLAETGLPTFEATTWHGLLAPAGTPRDIVAKLNAETVKALNSPELIEKFKANGIDPVSSSPEQFAALIKTELQRWGDVVKAAGVKPE